MVNGAFYQEGVRDVVTKMPPSAVLAAIPRVAPNQAAELTILSAFDFAFQSLFVLVEAVSHGYRHFQSRLLDLAIDTAARRHRVRYRLLGQNVAPVFHREICHLLVVSGGYDNVDKIGLALRESPARRWCRADHR